MEVLIKMEKQGQNKEMESSLHLQEMTPNKENKAPIQQIVPNKEMENRDQLQEMAPNREN